MSKGKETADIGARLFNCCTGNAAPDWSRFTRLEIGGCKNDPEEAGHIIGGQDEASAEFFTVYGRGADGMAEAITDCPDVAGARAVGGELSKLSGLPVREMFAPLPRPHSFHNLAEAACCIWECLIEQRARGDALNIDSPAGQTAADIQAAFDRAGASAMRYIAIELAPLCCDVWEYIGADGAEAADLTPYDWEFVPQFVFALDWSPMGPDTDHNAFPARGTVAAIAAAMIAARAADVEASKAKLAAEGRA